MTTLKEKASGELGLPLRVALAQTRQTDDFDDNCAAIFEALESASGAGAQIVCLPEAQTVGYRVDIVPVDAPVPATKLDAVHRSVAARCKELNLACILGTETPVTGAKPLNTALVISEYGEILGSHHKSALTPLDAVAYSPGDGVFETFTLWGVCVGVVICFEGFRFAETTSACVAKGAQLIFHPQNNTTRPALWKEPIHRAMIVTRAAENTVYFASTNACLPPHQDSASMVVAPDGRIVAQTELCQETVLIADIDIALATRAMWKGWETMDDTAPVLFGDQVEKSEYSSKL